MENLLLKPVPAAPSLAQDEVHVWSLDLDLEPERRADWWGLLSELEQQRTSRFRFERDRARFVTGHGQLRLLLGRYTGLEPMDLKLFKGPQGKPFLVDSNIHFNLSHCQGRGLAAFSLDRPLGVDIEAIREDINLDEIAESYFSAGERSLLRHAMGREKQELFFRLWTLKEAYLKARGEGLSRPLDSIEFDLWSGIPVWKNPPGVGGPWSFSELRAGPGFKASLAVEGRRPGIKSFEFH